MIHKEALQRRVYKKNEAGRHADTFISNEQHCSPIYPKVVAKTHDFPYLVYMYVLQVGIFCSSLVFRSMAAKKPLYVPTSPQKLLHVI